MVSIEAIRNGDLADNRDPGLRESTTGFPATELPAPVSHRESLSRNARSPSRATMHVPHIKKQPGRVREDGSSASY
jgi:hypothetical protein